MKRGSVQKLKDLNDAKLRLTAEYKDKVQEMKQGLADSCDLGGPSDAFFQEIGARVLAVRNDSGLTQEIVGILVGFTTGSIANIESGRQHPRLVTLVRLGELFGCDYREFLPKGDLKEKKAKKKVKR